MKNKILFFLFIMLVIVSCRKDDISDGLINEPPAPMVTFQTDLIGSVVDQDGRVLSNVQVSSGQDFTTTDNNGLFRIDGLSVDGALGAYISADAEGYFSGGARLYTQGTHARQIEITLIEKELSGYVNATKEESISLENGLKIDFPANGFTSNGSDYGGLVSIYAYHLDPSKEGYLDMSPGDLSGTDELNNNYILESFGMIAVEMETAGGQPVQLKEGSFSTISVPVDASLLGDAPSELPLWHFDDGLGKWVKEGTAELIDGQYVGQVSHFSWWNCDDFIDAATLCIQVFDSRFMGSLAGVTIELTTQSQGSSTGVTDTEGFVIGQIPSNETIEVTIYDLCGEIVYTGTIGPFTGNDNKEIIPLVLANLDLYHFTGTVYDCESMESLANAIVNIKVGVNAYYTETNENGVYSYFALACVGNVEYEVIAYDIIQGVAGYSTGIAILGENNVVDINLCNEAQFLIINGELVSDENVIARRKPNETLIFANLDIYTYVIGINGFTVGTFPAHINGELINSSNCTVTITQFDGIGGTIKGTIQGVNDVGSLNIEGAFAALVEE